MPRNKILLTTGAVGTGVAALCCFTPVLVVVFAAVGLSAFIGYLDYVLLPALACFLGLTAYALYRRRKVQRCCERSVPSGRRADFE